MKLIAHFLDSFSAFASVAERITQVYRNRQGASAKRNTLLVYYLLCRLHYLCSELVASAEHFAGDDRGPTSLPEFAAAFNSLYDYFKQATSQLQTLNADLSVLTLYVDRLSAYCLEPMKVTAATLGGYGYVLIWPKEQFRSEIADGKCRLDDLRKATATLAEGIDVLRSHIRETVPVEEAHRLTKTLAEEADLIPLNLFEQAPERYGFADR